MKRVGLPTPYSKALPRPVRTTVQAPAITPVEDVEPPRHSRPRLNSFEAPAQEAEFCGAPPSIADILSLLMHAKGMFLVIHFSIGVLTGDN